MGRPRKNPDILATTAKITTTADGGAAGYVRVIDRLETKVDRLCTAMEHVAEKLDRFFEGRLSSEVQKRELSQSLTSQEVTQVTTTPQETLYPVPLEFRHLVDDLLNKNFGVEIAPSPDSPSFNLIIIVPDKYSTISDDYRRMYGRDIRPKMITYSEGVVGVRAYLDKVWSSFNPTIQALIVNDRIP